MIIQYCSRSANLKKRLINPYAPLKGSAYKNDVMKTDHPKKIIHFLYSTA